MAASSPQSVDDMLMCLVGMGFELEDSQQAVQAGKLTVEAAVEWLLAGKPAPTPTPPADSGNTTLRLGGPRTEATVIGSNPFSNPQPVAPAPVLRTADPVPTGVQREEGDGEASAVISRMHLNDEQRQIKERFEEKQRLEAQQQAKQEKLAQKKARAEALRQIQEDRDRVKMKSSPGSSSPGGGRVVGTGSPGSGGQRSPGVVQGSPSAGPSLAKNDSLLQVRLPDGRALKQTFPADSELRVVWKFVESKYPQCQGMCLMQPFPRQEFGSQHMSVSLRELGLFPTGSLVLKKTEGGQAKQPEVPMDLEREPGDGEVDYDDVQQGSSQGGAPSHKWGTGNTLAPGDSPGGGNVDESDDDNMDSSDEDQVGHGGLPGLPGQIVPPMWGPGGGGGGGAGAGWGFGGPHGFSHQWGDGQSMMEIVVNEDNLPHRTQNPRELAAEAARQRYAQHPPQMEDDGAGAAASTASYSQDVTPLVQMVIDHVSGRICDTRKPITGLQGIPADVAVKVLNHLIKERLLRPKTLQPFVSCHLNQLILDCYPYATNELLAAVRLHVYLTHLGLASCPLITDKGLQPLIALKRLRVLSLASCRQITNNCISVITELKNLVTLVLEDTGVSDPGVIQYAQTAPSNLQHLDISRTEVTHRTLMSLQAIPNLKILNLEQTKVGDLSGIEKMTCLEALNVAGTPIVTSSLLLLSRCPQLNMLNIANTPEVEGNTALSHLSGLQLHSLQLPSRLTTTDQGIQYIADMPLHTLDLTNYIHIGDGAAEYIGRIHSLKKLRLGNTKITDTGMIFLEGLRNLTELLLDRTAVSDVGARIVQGFTSLQELSLSETSISDGFLKSGSLNRCIMLSKLNLSKTRITDKGIVHLSLPHLALLNIEGTRMRPTTVQNLPNCPQLQRVTFQNLYTPPGTDEEEDMNQ